MDQREVKWRMPRTKEYKRGILFNTTFDANQTWCAEIQDEHGMFHLVPMKNQGVIDIHPMIYEAYKKA